MTSPRVALITGATGGLGLQVAKDLAAKGCSLLIVGRGAEKLRRAREEVSSFSSGSLVSAIDCDFSSLEQVRRAASEALEQSSSIDLVLLNAAMWPSSGKPKLVAAGAPPSSSSSSVPPPPPPPSSLEEALVVNHLSQFLLARLLVPALRRSERGGRCVFVSSELHRTTAPLPPTPAALFDVSAAIASGRAPPSGYTPRAAYASTKLLNVMSAREMQRRELAEAPGSRVRFAAASPGFVPSTGLSRNAAGSGAAAWLFRTLAPYLPFAVSLKEGARRLEAALEAADGGDPGGAGEEARYYAKGLPAEPSAAALDGGAAAEMWRLTEEALVASGALSLPPRSEGGGE